MTPQNMQRTPWRGVHRGRLLSSRSGVLHALLRLPDYERLLGHPILGKNWEGFVIEKALSSLPLHVQPFFYRTAAGAEIDLLLEVNLDEYWAIEIKSGRNPNVTKGFHIACEELGVRRKFVVYTGEGIFPIDKETTVLSLPLFLEALNGL